MNLPESWRLREQEELMRIYRWWVETAIKYHDFGALGGALGDMWKSVEDKFLSYDQAKLIASKI